VNDEFDRTGTEAVIAQFEVLPLHSSGRNDKLRGTSFRIIGVQTEIRTRYSLIQIGSVTLEQACPVLYCALSDTILEHQKNVHRSVCILK
jgi:hypothetical protein